MERNVSLINQLRQSYLDDSNVCEQDGFNSNSEDLAVVYTWPNSRGYSKKELRELLIEKVTYIGEKGVDNKFMITLRKEFVAGRFPTVTVIQVVDYICKLKVPEYIAKFIEYERWGLNRILINTLIKTKDAECIKNLAKRVHFKLGYKEIYRNLMDAYNSIIADAKEV